LAVFAAIGYICLLYVP